MAISKRRRNILLCGKSTEVISPRSSADRVRSPTFVAKSGSSGSLNAKRKFGIFRRIRLFYSRFRERFFRRSRRVKPPRRQISVPREVLMDPAFHRHPSISKIPSLSVIMEMPEAGDEFKTSGERKESRRKKLKAVFAELDSGADQDSNASLYHLGSSTSTLNDVKSDESIGSSDWSSSAEGDSLVSAAVTQVGDNSVTEFNKCSSAVVKSSIESAGSTLTTPPCVALEEKLNFERKQKVEHFFEADLKEIMMITPTPSRTSSVETIGRTSSVETLGELEDVSKSSTSNEALKEDLMNDCQDKVQGDGKYSRKDEVKEERKKKSNTKRVHFSEEKTLIFEPKIPTRPATEYISDEHSIDKVSKGNYPEVSDGGSNHEMAKMQQHVSRPTTRRYPEAKVHPMIARKFLRKKIEKPVLDPNYTGLIPSPPQTDKEYRGFIPAPPPKDVDSKCTGIVPSALQNMGGNVAEIIPSAPKNVGIDLEKSHLETEESAPKYKQAGFPLSFQPSAKFIGNYISTANADSDGQSKMHDQVVSSESSANLKREKGQEAKAHPAVARNMIQNRVKTPGLALCYNNYEGCKDGKKVEGLNPLTSQTLKESLNKDESPYTLRSVNKSVSDVTEDAFQDFKTYAQNIVQQTTLNSLQLFEKMSTEKDDQHSSKRPCFSLFDEEEKSCKKLVREIISDVVKKDDNSSVYTDLDNASMMCDERKTPAVLRGADDDSFMSWEYEPTDNSDNITRQEFHGGSNDESYCGMEYEPKVYKADHAKRMSGLRGVCDEDSRHHLEYQPTDDSDMDVDDLPFDYEDDDWQKKSYFDKTSSVISGWNQVEDLARSISACAARVTGSDSFSEYSKGSEEERNKKKMNGRIIIHDPEHMNRKPIRYPAPAPRETTLAPNPFPVNKNNLPEVGNPKVEGYYSRNRKKNKIVKNPLLPDDEDDMPVYVEPAKELGLLKEITNRWVPTPAVFLRNQEPELEKVTVTANVAEPLAPIAGSRTSPVSDDVLFPDRRDRESNGPVYVYTQPIGKLSTCGRDSSGIDVSCFTGKPSKTTEKKEKKKGKKHGKKNGKGKMPGQVPEVAPEHMEQFKKMQVTFRARDEEVPDAKFWIDLNQGKFDDDKEPQMKSKKSKQKQAKEAWGYSEQSYVRNKSDNSSNDQLPEELSGSKSKPLAAIGSKESSKVSYEKAKENFHFFKAVGADPMEPQRRKDTCTDMKVLQNFHKSGSQIPLAPIEDNALEPKCSAAENMYFFKHVTTQPEFWSRDAVPRPENPKPYIPKNPLNPIGSTSPNMSATPAENMEFFRAVSKYPKQFYDVPSEPKCPKDRPYFLEAPIGSTTDNAGRRHLKEEENLKFFKYVSNNTDFYKDRKEFIDNTNFSSPEDDHYIDAQTAEDNMRFFRDVAKNPSSFYKTKASKEAMSQLPKRRESEIPDDPANYIDEKTAQENLEFFKKHAKKSKSKSKHKKL